MKGDLENAKKYADKVIRSEKFQFVGQEDLSTFMKRRISLSETIWGLYTTKISSYLYDRHVAKTIMTLPSDWRLLYKNTEGSERGKINDCLLGFFLKKIQEIGKIFVLKIMEESNDASEYSEVHISVLV